MLASPRREGAASSSRADASSDRPAAEDSEEGKGLAVAVVFSTLARALSDALLARCLRRDRSRVGSFCNFIIRFSDEFFPVRPQFSEFIDGDSYSEASEGACAGQ